MKLVIKIGGHIFASYLDPKGIKEYAKLLRKLRGEHHRVVVVIGGGEDARRYIKVAKMVGGSEFNCDLLGIDVSRLNARLLIAGLGDDAYPEPLRSLEELRREFKGDKVVVMGGLQPGQSTNAVGALVAEAIEADLFINATDVDGVYTSDPKKDREARKLDIVYTDKLLALTSSEKLEAGGYTLFDPIAVKIVERSGIPTRIVNGRETANIERAVYGESVGTLVKSAKKKGDGA